MNIVIVQKDINEIELIRPLWEKLNAVHFEKSVHFKSKYEDYAFEERIKSIYIKEQRGIIKLDMLYDSDAGEFVGYCLSSIEEEDGEIESIFIDKHYRKYGLGRRLMESALRWFEHEGITNIQIGVVYANDEALPFYERYGFKVSSYVLKRKWRE